MNSNTVVPAQSLFLIVDPYSTGCMVAQEISKRGYPNGVSFGSLVPGRV